MTNINTTIEQELMTDCCSANYNSNSIVMDEDTGEEFARCDACGEMATIIDAAKI